MSTLYKSEDEIAAVVQGFESCTTPAADFNHRAHLTVAIWFLSHSTVPEAVLQMRTAIFRFVDHHQVSREKYHETLTVFWLRIVRQYLDDLDSKCSLLEATNGLIESVGNSQVVFDYYSKERLWSDEARRVWLEPDLRHLRSDAETNVYV